MSEKLKKNANGTECYSLRKLVCQSQKPNGFENVLPSNSDKKIEVLERNMKQCSITQYLSTPSKEPPIKTLKNAKKKCPRKVSTKYNKRKVDYNLSPKITKYTTLRKNAKQSDIEDPKEPSESNSPPEMVSKDNDNDEKNISANRERVTRAKTAYQKYGVRIPSFQTIVREQKEFDNYKHNLDNVKLADYPSVPEILNSLQSEIEANSKKALHCKDLTMDEIESLFSINIDYIGDLINGKSQCNKHERLQKNTTYWTEDDVTFNTCMMTFNFEQKRKLLKLLQAHFEVDNQSSEFFFKVLLPEMCFKIFMDVHGMNSDKAMNYLFSYPVMDF